MTNLKEASKLSLINIIKEHKLNCRNDRCEVSLYLLRVMAEDAGIKFTKEEKEMFL